MPNPKRCVFAQAIRCFPFALLMLALSGCQMVSGHAANNLGSGYYREGNYVAARHSFQQAVAEMPENADFRHNLAVAMQKQGDLRGAEQVYQQALYLDPSHQPSYHGLAQMMIQQGRQAEAAGMLQSWVATQTYSPTPHVEMAWLQQQQGNQYAAAQSLQTALKLEPNHPVALAQLGQVYQESGQPELAVAYYQRSLQGNWRQPEVQTRLATLMPHAAPQTQPTQVAFGMPQPWMASAQPAAHSTAWLPPRNGFAGVPSPLSTTTASVPFGRMPQSGMTASAQPAPARISGQPPQIQTAWLPPRTAAPQWAGQTQQGSSHSMPSGPSFGAMPQSLMGQQPTPVDSPQFHTAGPTPTFASAPPNADPAHVPQMTAELPITRPF